MYSKNNFVFYIMFIHVYTNDADVHSVYKILFVSLIASSWYNYFFATFWKGQCHEMNNFLKV